jgi:peroxiredoxin/Flp pilus assembly protein TadD
MSEYEHIEKSLGDDVGANINYADQMFDQGNHDAANHFYNRATELAPGSARAHYKYAQFLQSHEYFDDAEGLYKKAVELDGKDPFAHLYYAGFKHVVGDYGAAEGLYKKAIELRTGAEDPTEFSSAYYWYGLLLGAAERYDEAEAMYKSALELNAENWNIYNDYKEMLLGAGRPEDAQAVVLGYNDACGEAPWPYIQAGMIELNKAEPDMERAKGYYEKAVRLIGGDPDGISNNLIAYYHLSYIYGALGDLEKGLEYAETVLDYDCTLWEIYETDPTFEPLRNAKRYPKVIKKGRDAYDKYVREKATVPPGKKAPNFELEDTDGNDVKLSDFAGKLVVLNVWATWCGPCRNEMPDFAAFYDEYKDRGVVVLGVSVDEDMDADELAEAAAEFGANYPILQGDEEVSENYIAKAGVIPETYIIGSDGKVLDFISGMTDRMTLTRKVDRFLGT